MLTRTEIEERLASDNCTFSIGKQHREALETVQALYNRLARAERVIEALEHHRLCLDDMAGLSDALTDEYEEGQLRLANAWDAVDAALDEWESKDA